MRENIKEYHINENVSLIILKYEKISNISSERSLHNEVYEPFNKTKLNLSICDNTSISVYLPITLSEEIVNIYKELKELGYDLFNVNSSFYNDICTPYKSTRGTDILLSDRKEYYFNNIAYLCQSNCAISNYSIETRLVVCDCDVSNTQIDTKITKKLNKKTLYQSFYDTLKYSNYKVLYCYKLAFHIDSVTVNKGSILTIIYFAFYFVFLIIYGIEGIRRLKIYYARRIFRKKKVTQ